MLLADVVCLLLVMLLFAGGVICRMVRVVVGCWCCCRWLLVLFGVCYVYRCSNMLLDVVDDVVVVCSCRWCWLAFVVCCLLSVLLLLLLLFPGGVDVVCFHCC